MTDCPHYEQTMSKGFWMCKLCGLKLRPDYRSSIELPHIAPSAMPSRRNSVAPAKPNNSFEKGIRHDERGLPYLDRKGLPLTMKEKFDRRDYRETITVPTTGRE